jgi:hypothetical protein
MCSAPAPCKEPGLELGSLALEEKMADSPLNRGQPDRSKINMSEEYETRHWCKHLGVDRGKLQKIIEKVGHSVRAVEKELGVHNAGRT